MGWTRSRRLLMRLIVTLLVAVCGAGATIAIAHAQQIWAGGYGRTPPRFPTANDVLRRLQFLPR